MQLLTFRWVNNPDQIACRWKKIHVLYFFIIIIKRLY